MSDHKDNPRVTETSRISLDSNGEFVIGAQSADSPLLLPVPPGDATDRGFFATASEETISHDLARRQRRLFGAEARRDSSADDVIRPQLAFKRALPVTIYLADEADPTPVEAAARQVLDAFGFDVVGWLPPIRGSWYKAFTARTKDSVNSPEFKTRLKKVERALELQTMHRAQAEIDAAQGDAVAKLITSLAGSPNAIIQIGSVLLIKVDGVPVVRNLTRLELAHLEQNPALFRDPAGALHELQQVNAALIQSMESEAAVVRRASST